MSRHLNAVPFSSNSSAFLFAIKKHKDLSLLNHLIVLMYRCEILVLTLSEEQFECNQCSDLAMGWGIRGFECWQKQQIFFCYYKISRLAVGHTQPAVEGVT
jgi:hypothetical protein